MFNLISYTDRSIVKTSSPPHRNTVPLPLQPSVFTVLNSIRVRSLRRKANKKQKLARNSKSNSASKYIHLLNYRTNRINSLKSHSSNVTWYHFLCFIPNEWLQTNVRNDALYQKFLPQVLFPTKIRVQNKTYTQHV